MGKWSFLDNIQNLYSINLRIEEDEATLVNPDNGKCVNIYTEEYYSEDGQDIFVEYIVCFATQHRHFDEMDDVEEYIHMILKDEILAIEFYELDKRKFGGEIEKSDYEIVALTLLSQRWGYSLEYLSATEYEIHSWSGKYDSGRKKISDIK